MAGVSGRGVSAIAAVSGRGVSGALFGPTQQIAWAGPKAARVHRDALATSVPGLYDRQQMALMDLPLGLRPKTTLKGLPRDLQPQCRWLKWCMVTAGEMCELRRGARAQGAA